MAELSGSPAINPKPGNIPIKDRAIHHKVVQVKTVRAIIDESVQDLAKPTAV